ncbi:MAG: hypothetical protein K2K25_02935 [Muribaculaceae bacterium]|nr:hypothetical protein [Muribaculaceae bacterium]
MERNILNYTFVGILEKPVVMSSIFDDDSLYSILDLPYETLVTRNENGIIVQAQNRYIGVILNPERILLTAENPEQLSLIKLRLFDELKRVHHSLSLVAYGLNYEIEYIKLDKLNSQWLWKNFMHGIQVGDVYHECHKLDFRLGINKGQYFNFSFELRANNPYGIFLTLNHHHQCYPPTDASEIDIKKMIDESIELYYNKYECNLGLR